MPRSGSSARVALIRSLAPSSMTKRPAVGVTTLGPSCKSLVMVSVPPRTTVLPLWVLLPVRINSPKPVLMKSPEPV